MESLVSRMEDLAASLDGPAGAADNDAALSPTNRLAAMLKEALAANTIGGKVDDGSRLRAAAEDVRQAQASWSRIGAVPDEARRPLRSLQRAAANHAETGEAGRPAVVGARGGSRPIRRAGKRAPLKARTTDGTAPLTRR